MKVPMKNAGIEAMPRIPKFNAARTAAIGFARNDSSKPSPKLPTINGKPRSVANKSPTNIDGNTKMTERTPKTAAIGKRTQ